MRLVLCHSDDISALWAFRQLKAKGLEALELVSVESLACSLRWEHRIRRHGDSLDLRLPDKRRIIGDDVTGVLNRMHSVPLHLWRMASEKDRDYFHQEMLALHVSWLHSLGDRVLNPPSPDGLSGAWRCPAVWTQLAARAGLSVRRYSLGDESDCLGCGAATYPAITSVIVVGGVVSNPDVPESIATACVRLSKLAQTPLLGVELERDAVTHDWRFSNATPLPDLRVGGPKLIDALEGALRAQGEAA
jgi:hypothetical protein